MGADTDLTTTMLVLENEVNRVAIVALDLAFLHGELVRGIRRSLSEPLSTPESHTLLNCSHTHSGPPMRG